MYKSTKWKYPRSFEFQEGIQRKMEILTIIFAFQVHTVPNKVDHKKVALNGDRPIFLKDKEACIKHVQMIAQTQMNNRSHRKVCVCSPVVYSHIFFLGKPHEKLQTDKIICSQEWQYAVNSLFLTLSIQKVPTICQVTKSGHSCFRSIDTILFPVELARGTRELLMHN